MAAKSIRIQDAKFKSLQLPVLSHRTHHRSSTIPEQTRTSLPSPVSSMMRFLFLFLCLTVVPVEASEMQLVLRQASVDPSTHPVTWKPQQTAAIVCDMWDQHWCAGASQRVAEMAPPMNEFLKLLRSQGVLIVHAPSTCVDFYEKTAARRRAQEAPQPLALSQKR